MTKIQFTCQKWQAMFSFNASRCRPETKTEVPSTNVSFFITNNALILLILLQRDFHCLLSALPRFLFIYLFLRKLQSLYREKYMKYLFNPTQHASVELYLVLICC